MQLDETYLRESFKDNHTRGEFRLLRPARHRGTPASKRGLSGEQICVMTGVADDDSAFLTVSGHGIISKNRAIAALDGRIAKGAGRPGRSLSRRHRDIGHRVHAHQGRRPRHQPRQHLHSLLDGFMAGFRGVSTKRLGEYLTWFLWRRTFRWDRAVVLARQVNVTACDNPVRDWAHIIPPYMGYWGEAA